MVAINVPLLMNLAALAGNVIWNGTFEGEAGKAVDTSVWNIITK